MTYRIACIGEPLAEISMTSEGMKFAYGGDTLNTAIYLARETAQKDFCIDYVTILGEDAASEGALALMEKEGLSTRHIRRVSERNMGIYAIKNDPDGERHFHYWRSHSAARQLFDTPTGPEFEAIQNAQLVYLSGITLAIMSPQARTRLLEALKDFRATGGKLAFDSNYRASLWEDTKSAQACTLSFWGITDIGLPTIEDELAIFGDHDVDTVMHRLNYLGVQQGAIKQGVQGPKPLSGSSLDFSFPAAKTVRDTTGAGDSFNAAFLAAYVSGASEAACLEQAHALARKVVGHQGAILDNPNPPKVQRLGSTIGLKPEHAEQYIALHADVWPGVLKRIKQSNIHNYSIFLKTPEHVMFSYFEYDGTDFDADMAAIAADPITQDWWAVCGPMQEPFETRKDGEWWADMKPVFYLA